MATYCNRCNTEVSFDDVSPDYYAVCPHHDEDLYKFETYEAEANHLVYAWECGDCWRFFGENTLTTDGRLLCPSCHNEQNLESSYVERIRVLTKPDPYLPECQGTCDVCVGTLTEEEVRWLDNAEESQRQAWLEEHTKTLGTNNSISNSTL